MNIQILWPWELPDKIEGTAVVIDVLAATSNIAWFLSHQVKKLIIVNSRNIDLAINKYKEAIVIGESLEPRFQSYFSASNSPAEIETVGISSKIIIYMSNNGSKVIERALERQAEKVLTVSFTNLDSVAKWLQNNKREKIVVIPSGEVTPDIFPDKKSKDDLICAQAFRDYLIDKKIDWDNVLGQTAKIISQYYPYNKGLRKKDVELITKLNSNPVVPICHLMKDRFVRVNLL